MTFSDKIKRSREIAGLTQDELAAQVGVSRRTITAYECTSAMARRSTIAKLARALRVSVRYLTDDACIDPLADIEKDAHVEAARRLYGAPGARDVASLLNENTALFAGGELSQEEKDAFFEAVMRAYVACKDEARKKYGTENLRAGNASNDSSNI